MALMLLQEIDSDNTIVIADSSAYGRRVNFEFTLESGNRFGRDDKYKPLAFLIPYASEDDAILPYKLIIAATINVVPSAENVVSLPDDTRDPDFVSRWYHDVYLPRHEPYLLEEMGQADVNKKETKDDKKEIKREKDARKEEKKDAKKGEKRDKKDKKEKGIAKAEVGKEIAKTVAPAVEAQKDGPAKPADKTADSGLKGRAGMLRAPSKLASGASRGKPRSHAAREKRTQLRKGARAAHALMSVLRVRTALATPARALLMGSVPRLKGDKPAKSDTAKQARDLLDKAAPDPAQDDMERKFKATYFPK
eukprot:TRINITY_DN17027_c0_g1_i1.p2 TRINITY_DN17027_c0_g1~~TRINITY_DN17027_c0_g1_i1.p2  ORF type:complete len:308 (+),score=89.40 TRINITY_DN17027_c0_g1_i1:1756-2679(+)